jgi:methoxymalonate biosynthesis acyl carrier protein
MTSEDEKKVREKVRAFVLASVCVTDLRDDADLFETGLVTSLFAVQLLTFLEKTFSIDVTMDDLEIDNFRSIHASAAFVARKHGLLV